MLILLYIFKWHMQFIYFFIKLFTRQREQVFFLSRQFNELPLNYKYIIDELKRQKSDIKIKIICKKVGSELNETIRDTNKVSKANLVIFKLLKQFKSSFNYYISLYKQMYLIAKSTVIIVDGYNVPVSMLKHKKNTTVIQIWHALAAIKKFGYQTVGYADGINPKIAKILKMHKNYDYVISGSDEMKKYFSEAFNVPIEKVTSIGTPYIDDLLKNEDEEIEKAYKKHPELKNKINIMYSPTFRRDGRDYIQDVINNVDSDKYNLIITYHSKDEKKNNELSDKTLNCSDIPYKILMRMVDYIITDYSALSIEAAIVRTKILLYICDVEQYTRENGINIDLYKELPKYTSTDIKELLKVIDENNYDTQILENFRKKYASNLTGTSTKLITEIILKNIEKKQEIDLEEMENRYNNEEDRKENLDNEKELKSTSYWLLQKKYIFQKNS